MSNKRSKSKKNRDKEEREDKMIVFAADPKYMKGRERD